jgi:hypothetical protein
MNYDFSIESGIDKIQNEKTKEYFKEVYQTFVNKNYRSSIVMLYSVLICDLVYKLRDLRDIYGDVKVKKVLDEIEALQKANPTSPDWESKLIELIEKRTGLLESSDIVAISSLQKFRHLSAHPVLNNSDLLYSPNRDTTQALIRNILEGVLTNPPFFSNKIFDTMLNDLAEIKNQITEDEKLDKYLKSRYLNKLKDNDFKKVFRSFWKIVFNSEDDHSNENRIINYRALKRLIAFNKSICLELIKNEQGFYSNINKDEHIGRIIPLLTANPDFFALFENSLQLLIEKKIATDDNYRLLGWFIKPTITEHLSSLKPEIFKKINPSAFRSMQRICKANSCEDALIIFAINYWGASKGFDISKNRFDDIINDILPQLNIEQSKHLLATANSNPQIYHQYSMKPTLKAFVEQRFEEEIIKTDYPNIY